MSKDLSSNWWGEFNAGMANLSCPGSYDTGYLEQVEGNKKELVMGCKLTQCDGSYSSQILGWKNDWVIGGITKIGLAQDSTIVPAKSEIVATKYEIIASKKSSSFLDSLLSFVTLGIAGITEKAGVISATKRYARWQALKAYKKDEIGKQENLIGQEETKIAEINETIGRMRTNLIDLEEKGAKVKKTHVKQQYSASARELRIAIDNKKIEVESSQASVRKYKDEITRINGLTVLP